MIILWYEINTYYITIVYYSAAPETEDVTFETARRLQRQTQEDPGSCHYIANEQQLTS